MSLRICLFYGLSQIEDPKRIKIWQSCGLLAPSNCPYVVLTEITYLTIESYDLCSSHNLRRLNYI